MRSSFGAATLSAAPYFAMMRRGSTPVALPPNKSTGSGRHSILKFRLIVTQSNLRHFYGQKVRVYEQIVDEQIANVDCFATATQKCGPKCEVCLHVLVAIKFDPTCCL